MQIILAENQYNLLIIGANGGIGRQCVEQALQAGHKVTALVRNPANLPLTHLNLTIVKGDITISGTYEKYFAAQDAVISALGVSGANLFNDKPTTLYSQGASNILQAMHQHNINRAFFISASALDVSPVIPFYVRFVAKYIIQKLLKHAYADLRLMEQVIKASPTNWTIMRPPQLTNRPLTRHYRVAVNHFLKNCLKISRADVAYFIINHITDNTIYKATVEIAE